jgi:hypothetical protein
MHSHDDAFDRIIDAFCGCSLVEQANIPQEPMAVNMQPPAGRRRA